MHNEVLETIIKTENQADEIIQKAKESATALLDELELKSAAELSSTLDKGKEHNKKALEEIEIKLKEHLNAQEEEKMTVPCREEDIKAVSYKIVDYVSKTVFE